MKKFLSVFFILLLASAALAQNNYTIQQYLSIRSAGSPTLSPDGKRLFYLTNVTGTSQVWMIDLPGGTPKQITNYEDNVSFVRFSPKGEGAVFGKAHGGDENTQFFWMKPDGTDSKELTNNPKVRHDFGDWAADGSRIYYSSNKRNPQFFDVYSMNVSTGKEELLYQNDGNNDFADASRNGSKIIVSRSGTELSLDNNLYLVDVESKKETLLTPHADASEFSDVKFLPDGDSIIFTSNKDREFAAMTQVDNLRDGVEPKAFTIKPEQNWDTEAIAFPERGSHFAYTLNREGFSELHLRKFEVDGKPLITNIL